MNKQLSLSGLMDELAQARTKKKEFLEQMDQLIPWRKWVEEIRPCYYKGERGNKPYGIELMLRLYVLQNLYTLSDEGTVAEVIDSRAFSDFCGVDSSSQVPDGDTLGRFRNLLIRNGIQERLFAQVTELLREQGLLLKKGTIVDSTLVSAPSSTKNREKKHDPEAHSTKKGSTWHFGYKAHIGVDKDTGVVHTLKVTAANVHDVTMTAELLSGRKKPFMAPADTLVLKSGQRPYCGTAAAKRFDIKSIAVLPRQKILPPVPGLRSSVVSGKNPLSEQKSSTFSQWSRAGSDAGKRDTEVCKSRLLN